MATSAEAVEGITTSDNGAGINYELKVVQDITLERGHMNHSSLHYLIVGLHPRYPKKRSLVQFHSLPSTGIEVISAKMYLYLVYSHKATFQTVTEAPYISRTLQVHLVEKEWVAMEATSTHRRRDSTWGTPYLGLDNIDAQPEPIDIVTIAPSRPSGWVEFDIMEAVKQWQAGKPNYGLLVLATNEDTPGRDIRFASKAAPDASTHAFVNVLCAYEPPSFKDINKKDYKPKANDPKDTKMELIEKNR